MTDRDDEVPEVTPRGPTPPKRRTWRWIVLLSVVVVPALLLGLWTAITMTYTYSSADIPGYVTGVEQRGWICKTWEGEVATISIPGTPQAIFRFTVRNDSIAEEISRLQGRRVVLHYQQHKGVPLSCVGETEFFVDGVQVVEDVVAPGIAPSPHSGDSLTHPGANRDTIDPTSGTP